MECSRLLDNARRFASVLEYFKSECDINFFKKMILVLR